MSDSGEYIVKLRGLPWATTAQDVADFFSDVNIMGGDEEGVHMTLAKDGRASGQCFVELCSSQDMETAKAHNKEKIGARYIEVFEAKRTEMEWQLSHSGGGHGNTSINGDGESPEVFTRLRGLPYEATKQDIAMFFTGEDIAPYGITITMDPDGRPSGEAYVEFTSESEVEKALLKNKEKIGHRYIEIFKCSRHDVKYISNQGFGGGFFPLMGGRPGPYDRPSFGLSGRGGLGPSPIGYNNNNTRGGGRGGSRGGTGRGGKAPGSGKADKNSKTGHMVHMRGLPFEASQGDVYRFLAPLIPTEVRMLTEESGRPKGECHVDFNTHSDAVAAMSKNKLNMGHRYIEIFLKSEPSYDSWANHSPMFNNGLNSSWW